MKSEEGKRSLEEELKEVESQLASLTEKYEVQTVTVGRLRKG